MSESMQQQIDEVVEQLLAPSGAIGIMTSKDVRELARKAVTQGTLIGYVAGEKLARTQTTRTISELNYQYEQLKSHCKNLEMEIMVLKR